MTAVRDSRWPAGIVAAFITATLAAPSAAVASAVTKTTASTGLYVRGAGYGHGVGMSQYGAAGYAQHGYGYRQILQRYYAQTTLGTVNPSRPVTVLLRARGAAAFRGADRIQGSKLRLNPAATYRVLVAGPKLRLMTAARTVGTFGVPLQITGMRPLTLLGLGAYRGSFVFRRSPSGSGVMTVNSLGLDAYVEGVVSAEMPHDWPQQALDAQAIAARTYAITAGAVGADFDVYDNTRSQMYGGVNAETPSGDAAVGATRGQVVEYDGRPVTTYFFASSGGRTESVQNVFAGIAPEAWLVSEPDPYDDSFSNPHYRWKLSLRLGAADARLGKLVDGRLKGIRIVRHGVSPRVIEAQVIGTKGTTTATGEQLQQDLTTPSTWMSFTTISARGVQTTSTVAQTTTTSTSTTTTSGGTGGSGLGSSIRGHVSGLSGRLRVRRTYAVSGSIYPAHAGAAVTVQRRSGHRWRRVGMGSVSDAGAYFIRIAAPGVYRVRYEGVTARKITVS